MRAKWTEIVLVVLVCAILGGHPVAAQGGDANLRAEVQQLREQLVKAIKAINEGRLAAAEASREREEFIRKFDQELATQNRTLLQMQQEMAEFEQQIAALQKQNADLKALVTRSSADLKKLVGSESDQRVAADRRIIEQLSEALEKGLTRIQEDAVTTRRPDTSDAPTGSAMRTYTVAGGDTLSAIATAFGVSVAKLKQVNNLRKDTIYVGQKLKIPED